MAEETKPKYVVPIMLGIATILNLIDWIMTDYAIKRGATELNPVSVWLIEHDLFNVFKFGGTILLVLVAGYVGWGESKGIFEKVPYGSYLYNVMAGMIIILIVAYVAVIWNNVVEIRRLL